MASEPWPYAWDIQGDALTISIQYDATFTGQIAPDGNSFSGPGADETINAPYDIRATRVA